MAEYVKIGRFSFDKEQAKKMSSKEFADTFKHAENAIPRGMTLEDVHKRYCGSKVFKKSSKNES